MMMKRATNKVNVKPKTPQSMCVNTLLQGYKVHCHPIGPMDLSFVTSLCVELSSFSTIPWENICIH